MTILEQILRVCIACCLYCSSGCASILAVAGIIMTVTSEAWLMFGIVSVIYIIIANQMACFADESLKGVYLW